MADLKEGVAIVTVGRTAPIPPGPQPVASSLPVVIASDQAAVPVVVQNQQITEVSLSLLGIPRAEVALGIFADVTNAHVNCISAAVVRATTGILGNSYTFTTHCVWLGVSRRGFVVYCGHINLAFVQQLWPSYDP